MPLDQFTCFHFSATLLKRSHLGSATSTLFFKGVTKAQAQFPFILKWSTLNKISFFSVEKSSRKISRISFLSFEFFSGV
jgi:hypothetical protein